MKLNQIGATPVLILVAVIGLVGFLGITSLASFQGNLFNSLFPKELSFAASSIVTIDGNLSTHPISPYIYGTAADTSAYQRVMGTSISRWGGNQISRSNWENSDSNSGFDWGLCHQAYLGRGAFSNVSQASGFSQTPGKALVDSVNGAKTQGMAFLYSVPMAGWVAKDGNNSNCSTGVPSNDGPPINSNGAITGYDPTANRNLTSIRSQTVKGSAFVYPPNLTDNVVYQDEGINYLKNQVGTAANGGVKFYAFDNEYDLWASTHRDIHPARESYDSLLSKYIQFGDMVKTQDPAALTTGPVSWGWTNYWYSPLDAGSDGYGTHADRNAHGNTAFLPWFLRSMRAHDTQVGRRTLDVLDVHFYPQSGQYSNDVSPNMQAIRLRAVRDLWDPTYTNESWMAGTEGGPQIQVIPRLKSWINQEYPGTKIGITEWNFGADNHINGALAIADVLGVFGREDVYLANYWTTPADQSPGYWAWRMYRNVDGNFLGFGDTSISAVMDPENANLYSVYASKSSATNETKVMLINKDPNNNQIATLNLRNITGGGTAKVYQYSKSDTSKINRLNDLTNINTSNYSYTMPSYSITMLVFNPSVPPGTSTGAPVPSPSATPPLSTTPYYIFNDALNSAWQNWSWGSTIDFNSSAQVRSGTRSIAWTPTEGWSGLKLHAADNIGVNTSTFNRLHFAIFGAAGTTDYQVSFNDGSGGNPTGTVSLTNFGGQPTAGQWKVYDIPLSAFGISGGATVPDVQFFNATPNAQSTIYVDELSFVGVQPSVTPTPSPSTQPSPTPTPTPSPSPIPSPSPLLPGDINGSGKVDIFDYNLLLTDYGATSGTGLRSDINNSGKVDIFDYNILLTNFGKTTP